MKMNFKKIKDHLLYFLENNEILKPVFEQIKKAEEKIKKDISESEVVQTIESFLGDKKEKIEDL